MLKVVVDRQKWYRGQGPKESKLLRTDGQMCCVGFACKAARLTDAQIEDWATVQEKFIKKAPALSGFLDNRAAGLYSMNDTKHLPDPIREQQIYELGQQIGLDFSFVD